MLVPVVRAKMRYIKEIVRNNCGRYRGVLVAADVTESDGRSPIAYRPYSSIQLQSIGSAELSSISISKLCFP